jgi:ATP synthase protein I
MGKQPGRQFRSLELVSVGFVLVASLLVGYGFGVLLDRWLGTEPVFAAVCFLLGMVAGFIEVFQIAKRASQRRD